MLDLIIENVTENVMKISPMCNNPRMRFLIFKLVKAWHDHIRKWGCSLISGGRRGSFLLGCVSLLHALGGVNIALLSIKQFGQISTDVRHEFVSCLTY